MSSYMTFPYQIDAAGRTATSDLPGYVQTLIQLVLETDPGERVNRPKFGAGLKSLVFGGMDDALAAAAATLIRSQLMQFLGDVISIQSLQVTFEPETMQIGLVYVITYTGQQVAQVVIQGLPGTVAPTGGSGRPTASLANA